MERAARACFSPATAGKCAARFLRKSEKLGGNGPGAGLPAQGKMNTLMGI